MMDMMIYACMALMMILPMLAIYALLAWILPGAARLIRGMIEWASDEIRFRRFMATAPKIQKKPDDDPDYDERYYNAKY